MILYVIVTKKQVGSGIDVALERACVKLGHTYERLIVEDVTLDDLRTMTFPAPGLLYRISIDPQAAAIETLLVAFHPGMFTTVYHPRTIMHPQRKWHELASQMAADLRIIPTSLIDATWLAMDDARVSQRLEPLGGFPVIIKTLGLTHGQGVEKIDSLAAFRTRLSEIDLSKRSVIARKYLAEYRNFRVIVIEDAVAAVIEYHKPADDFRTNASPHPQVSPVDLATLDTAISTLAVDAVRQGSALLGGVDILIEQPSGIAYLAEVNTPCYFVRAEEPSGVDLSSTLITAMIRKQEQERGLHS